jgi:very-short-patch-repair endonuclease
MLARAAAMRREPTKPEQLLWLALRQSRLGGYKFRRQAIIGGRIADFFCPAKGVIIEIDGETHDRERDLQRDAALRDRTGFVTLRFTNIEVMRQRDDVLRAILDALEGRPDRWGSGRVVEKEEEGRHHPPTPSSDEEGE